ncbi:hypothetical protein ONZ45_g5817 [Pleurotus djamor]|nr:hypothetical protein ONZ45_g5817 [Pleurotus djamor]
MIEELILGFVAGVASRAVSTPLNIVTLRLQTERKSDEEEAERGKEDDSDSDSEDEGQDDSSDDGIKAVFASIYREDGIAGFWRGFRLSILLSLNPSISLALFQLFRRAVAISRRKPAPPNPSAREAFIGGAVSKSIAVSILYPLLLAKTRLQASRGSSFKQVLVDSYTGHFHRHPSLPHHVDGDVPRPPAHKGKTKNLYQALSVQILKGFLNQGMTFLVKGRIEQLIVLVYMRKLL